MYKYYLVYYTSFDSDFDNYPLNYLLGLYDNEIKAKEICDKDFCKRTHYKELEVNESIYIKL